MGCGVISTTAGLNSYGSATAATSEGWPTPLAPLMMSGPWISASVPGWIGKGTVGWSVPWVLPVCCGGLGLTERVRVIGLNQFVESNVTVWFVALKRG